MKWIGALLILVGCGSTGMGMAAAYRREEALLRQLVECMVWMECELRCRATDLLSLFHRAANRTEGSLGALFSEMGAFLAQRVAPDAFCCMELALCRVNLPSKCRRMALQLGSSLGEFHLEGQLRQLEAVRSECGRLLEEHTRNRDSRLRSYQALGLCGGLALAILLL